MIVMVVLWVFNPGYAQDLPKQLSDALADSTVPENALRAAGVLRRYANSDQPTERVLARTALARVDRQTGQPARGLTWVQEYGQPIKENYEWPRVQAYIEFANCQFDVGKTFDAVKRLNGAKDHAEGLGRIAAQRSLSVISEQQPDLSKALDFEKGAMKTGKQYFKREKISESAGLAPHKPGHKDWEKLKPEIEDRITYLERLRDIERYGLDYVLYREAQEYRKANHPLAMDFTHVAAAFRSKEPMANKVPGADYQKALESYAELIESFEQNPYAEAAKLYSAVCKVHIGEADQAIRDLKTFYKADPDGLYRGEALKILGDIYLFHKWDQTNSEEAYNRSVKWLEAMAGRTRTLETYLVPEKSQKVSKPPVRVKVLTEEGMIKEVFIPSNALVNRTTNNWYLDELRSEVEWRIGFLFLVKDQWELAFQRFDQVLTHDEVLQKAVKGRYFNPYDRLRISRKNKSIVGTHEQSANLKGMPKIAIYWADLNFMLENFDEALNLYEEIKGVAQRDKSDRLYMRSLLGEILVKRELKRLDPVKDVKSIIDAVNENPKNESAPYLLEICAFMTRHEDYSTDFLLKKIYTNYPNSFFAPRARYNEILRCVPWSDDSLREKKIKEFSNDYPNEKKYIAALQRLDVRIKEWKYTNGK